MTSNVIAALCVASNLPQATKVRECYKIRYFGTYIRYLPTNIFRYHFRISTSSFTVELVYSVRIFFDKTSQKLSRISHALCLLIKITFR